MVTGETKSARTRISGTMNSTSQKTQWKLILWALAWALAIIGSAFVLKGNPAKDWIQSALFVGAVNVWLWQSRQVTSSRCKSKL
jgi:predicted membrane channel-forming protein YqfA (hemolysin III family)